MGTPKLMSLFLILVTLCTIAEHSESTSSVPASPGSYHSLPGQPRKGIRAAYWQSYNPLPASSINNSYFTHIFYAFLLLEPASYKLIVTPYHQTKIPEFISALRTRNPPVKTLLSIGGGGKVFSQMASTKLTRAAFINSSIQVARKFGFEGVDLNWEFPANVVDMSNLVSLYKQWRRAIIFEARINGNCPLLLTSAVYYSSKFIINGGPRSYPVATISKYVDWVSPMCYNYHGSWEKFTGEQSALYDTSILSTSYGIGSWIKAGVPPKKLVMGLPLFGRTWELQDPKVNGIGAKAVGVGPGDGILVYHQIIHFNSRTNATVVFDNQTVSYYSYSGTTWIGYDDVRSVKLKVRFAKSLGLGGYFFWALGQDKDWTLSRQASNAWM